MGLEDVFGGAIFPETEDSLDSLVQESRVSRIEPQLALSESLCIMNEGSPDIYVTSGKRTFSETKDAFGSSEIPVFNVSNLIPSLTPSL